MQLKTIYVNNFRRLKDVRIDCESETTIFVGANNSGKTSVSHLLKLFLGNQRGKFSFHDFNVSCWEAFSVAEKRAATETPEDICLPKISLDIWFAVEPKDLPNIIDILTRLDVTSNEVGVRIEYAPKSNSILFENYNEAREQAKNTAKEKDTSKFHPWPISLADYLEKKLRSEYTINYFALDRSKFDESYKPSPVYTPDSLGDGKNKTGATIVDSLLKVDFLDAQRHLADDDAGRNQNISAKFSQYYTNNLEKHATDFDALRAINESEADLTTHFEKVFAPLFESLSALGYPGLDNPQIIVKAAFNVDSLLSQHSKVFYPLGEDSSSTLTLPDRYNGLGLKNLIFMLVEILDFHGRWVQQEEDRTPLHLLFIEEPEAHLHAQLQQVFIRKVFEIIKQQEPEPGIFHTQLLVSTHSPHIVHESGFLPIRYFRRISCRTPQQATEVLNLSLFYNKETEYRDFLQRYMKLTHSELFFADAAIFVEGTVEKNLLPMMIEKSAPLLTTCSLSVLEVGGAFAHCFRTLIEFLDIPTLIITDLDSCSGEDRTACLTNAPDSITSNQTLIQWLPKLTKIQELLEAESSNKIQCRCALKTGNCTCKKIPRVRVTYQTPCPVTIAGNTLSVAGRTIEEAFAFENLEWCQADTQKRLGLFCEGTPPVELITAIHQKIRSNSFKKADFSLNMLLFDPKEWKSPRYIDEGLVWLAQVLSGSEATIQEENPNG